MEYLIFRYLFFYSEQTFIIEFDKLIRLAKYLRLINNVKYIEVKGLQSLDWWIWVFRRLNSRIIVIFYLKNIS